MTPADRADKVRDALEACARDRDLLVGWVDAALGCLPAGSVILSAAEAEQVRLGVHATADAGESVRERALALLCVPTPKEPA